MNQLPRIALLVIALSLSTNAFSMPQSTTQSFQIGFTIPVTVNQEMNVKSTAMKDKMITAQTEIRQGRTIKLVSIVAP